MLHLHTFSLVGRCILHNRQYNESLFQALMFTVRAIYSPNKANMTNSYTGKRRKMEAHESGNVMKLLNARTSFAYVLTSEQVGIFTA